MHKQWTKSEALGLYIHIPFCASRCSYCDFYTGVQDKKTKDSYVKAVLLALETQNFGHRNVGSIYFGGGTPSLLKVENVVEILNKINKVFTVNPNAEITFEVNPESGDGSFLAGLKKAGVNRISFGVQSSNPKELDGLGRIHSPQRAKSAILEGRAQGFKHISADLMLGIPYQTIESLHESIRFLTELPIDHLSVYMLQVEEGTPLATSPLLKQLPLEDSVADWYLETVEILKEKGFIQYEISNFAKKGGQAVHNKGYWELKPYLGIGPSAHSYLGGRRFFFPPQLEGFIKEEDKWGLLEEEGEGGDFQEYAMLSLRMAPGLSVSEAKKRYPTEDYNLLLQRGETFVKEGYLEIVNEVITLTPKGFLLYFQVVAELLA